jgi:glycosyltransferase involved in cell wall biosynthesis
MAFSKSLKCGNYVHFSGTVSDVWNYYSASDVLLMPSYYEGLPLTLIEAQTNALPCVVSDVVSSESDVTGCIKFLPLSDMTCWIQTAYERAEIGFERNGEVAAETYELVCKAGYSLDTLKRRLIQIYSGGALY